MILLLYLAGAIWAVPAYRYQINPDGVAYTTIAQKYLVGNFHDAVNAYWSPMFSWLLAPILSTGVSLLLGAKILSAIAGAGLLGSLWMLCNSLGLSPRARAIFVTAMAPVSLFLATGILTPDLLSVALAMLYLAILIRADYFRLPFSGVLCGIVGGFAYLAKNYTFGFILLHFSVVGLVWFIREAKSRRVVFIKTVSGLLAFSIVCGSWAMVLRHKYGHLTLGTAGTYNHRHFGPERQGIYYADTHGLTPPVNPTAISAGEDSAQRPLPPWSPFQSWKYFRYQLWLIYTNLIQLFFAIERFSFLGIFTLAISIVALIKGWITDRRPGEPVLVLLLAVLLFPTGYVILHVEDRYLSLIQIVIFLIGILLLERLPRFQSRRDEYKILMALLCLSVTLHPMIALVRHRWVNWDVYEKSLALKPIVPAGSRIACDSKSPDSPIDETLFLALHCKLSFYGKPMPTDTPDETLAELRNYNIQYFFVWEDPAPWPFLQNWPLLWQGPVEDRYLRVYRVMN